MQIRQVSGGEREEKPNSRVDVGTAVDNLCIHVKQKLTGGLYIDLFGLL